MVKYGYKEQQLVLWSGQLARGLEAMTYRLFGSGGKAGSRALGNVLALLLLSKDNLVGLLFKSSSRAGGVCPKESGVTLRKELLKSHGLDPYSSEEINPPSLGEPETEALDLRGHKQSEVEPCPLVLLEDKLTGLVAEGEQRLVGMGMERLWFREEVEVKPDCYSLIAEPSVKNTLSYREIRDDAEKQHRGTQRREHDLVLAEGQGAIQRFLSATASAPARPNPTLAATKRLFKSSFGRQLSNEAYTPAQSNLALCSRVLWRTENELQSNIAASMQPAGKERVNQTPENSAHMTQNQSRQIQMVKLTCHYDSPGHYEFEDTKYHVNQGKHRVTKRGSALSYPMFTLVTSEDIAGSRETNSKSSNNQLEATSQTPTYSAALYMLEGTCTDDKDIRDQHINQIPRGVWALLTSLQSMRKWGDTKGLRVRGSVLEDAGLRVRGSVLEDAGLRVRGSVLEDAGLRVRGSVLEDAGLRVRGSVLEDAGLRVRGSVLEDAGLRVRGSVLEDAGLRVRGSVLEDAGLRVRGSVLEDAGLRVRGSVLEDAGLRVRGSVLEDAGLRVRGSVLEDAGLRVRGSVLEDARAEEMDPVKVRAIHDWIQPTSVKGLQKFLGFANFYRRFIANFSSVVKPLTDLTKEGADVTNWSSEAVEAFQELKRRFTSAPVLRQLDVSLPFQVEVDASEIGAGAVLSQRESDGSLMKPCAFFSRKFSPAERNYDVGNRELLAMKWAFEEWQHWLEGAKHRVVVLTDHKNLIYLESAKRLNPRQARWSLFFSRFDFVLSRIFRDLRMLRLMPSLGVFLLILLESLRRLAFLRRG
ncbi:unnamed protein product [Ranitomeya imitator]|uniref:Reverse transcriptase RNase H-like domain-containing protein n=1 Tax=Ranitomeya imitator TaxID=111125 RepID=A0ABN9MHG0_9NEOB|nr:unnamed protein product [Ranitomeya imitator]